MSCFWKRYERIENLLAKRAGGNTTLSILSMTPLTTQDAEKDDGIFRVRMEKLATKMTLEAGSRCVKVNKCKQICPKTSETYSENQ